MTRRRRCGRTRCNEKECPNDQGCNRARPDCDVRIVLEITLRLLSNKDAARTVVLPLFAVSGVLYAPHVLVLVPSHLPQSVHHFKEPARASFLTLHHHPTPRDNLSPSLLRLSPFALQLHSLGYIIIPIENIRQLGLHCASSAAPNHRFSGF